MTAEQPSPTNIRFVMLGGFLGSGKTTALLRLARRYVDAGLRVAIITNDQGEGLVDTATFRVSGYEAEEIPKGCFCRRLDELLAAAGRLQDGHRPDVLLAEPIGSGTNLVNTVIKPLKEVYADRFSVAPYVALLDPQRAFTALTGTGPAGLSAKVLYLYKMQQNEADVAAINKVDTLSHKRLEELTALVAHNFPKAQVMAVSARTSEGFDALAAVLDGGEPAGRNAIAPADLDQPSLAEANERLGWLNAAWQITAARGRNADRLNANGLNAEGFDADRLLLDIAGAIKTALTEANAEPAHVKMILRCGDDIAIANLVGSVSPAELSRPCPNRLKTASLTVNARVEAEPGLLRRIIHACVEQVTAAHCVEVAGEGESIPHSRL